MIDVKSYLYCFVFFNFDDALCMGVCMNENSNTWSEGIFNYFYPEYVSIRSNILLHGSIFVIHTQNIYIQSGSSFKKRKSPFNSKYNFGNLMACWCRQLMAQTV